MESGEGAISQSAEMCSGSQPTTDLNLIPKCGTD